MADEKTEGSTSATTVSSQSSNNREHHHVHFIGVGGIGMSALCKIALEKGLVVSGSDQNSSAILQELEKKGMERTSSIKEGSLVVYSTAISSDHQEIKEAKKRKASLYHRAEYLQMLMEGKKGVAVAGTHGKTTTSSLLSWVMYQKQHSFAVGGILPNLATNGSFGKGDYFVFEADESDGSFLQYTPHGAIFTNMEEDHLDYWKSKKEMEKGFQKFVDQVLDKRFLFWCKDDEGLAGLNIEGNSYGFDQDSDLQITSYQQNALSIEMDVRFLGKLYSSIFVPLAGKHNALNAAAVFGMAILLGLPEREIRKAFTTFLGIKRRMEFLGEKEGVSFYDDYAHHPTEILASLKAAKEFSKGKRVIAIFQPHRYSRTKDFYKQFLLAFKEASQVIITDIYAAGEKSVKGISGEKLAEDVAHISGKEQVFYLPKEKLHSYFEKYLLPEDIVITMGAGDITHLGKTYLYSKKKEEISNV